LKEKYNHINTLDKLQALDEYLMSSDKPVFPLLAFDTETNGLQFHKDVVIGFSISPSPNVGFYIPLLEWVPDGTLIKRRKKTEYGWNELCDMNGHFRDVWREGKTYPESVTSKEYQPPELINNLLRRWTKQTQLLMHNAPFDCCMVIYNFDFNLADKLLCDTTLLKHVIDENTPHALKATAAQWSEELGFDSKADATAEQQELGKSVFKNGGEWQAKKKHMWRGDPLMVSKYACADTCLTFGLYEVGLKKLDKSQFEWFFEKEVMPLCKEVVVKMTAGGVYVDVPYFQELSKELEKSGIDYKNEVLKLIEPYLDDFTLVGSVDEVVSTRRVIEKIIELEHLDHPTKTAKGVTKPSLAKDAIKKANDIQPHWLWDYVLGEGEIAYSDVKINALKKSLYHETLGREHRFNIGSSNHLKWLFFTKLGHDPTSVPQTKAAKPGKPCPSLEGEILREHFLGKYDFVQPLLVSKKLDKLLNTYVKPITVKNHDGWIHVNMRQNGTISGRFSCSGINLQTLPKIEELGICENCESKDVVIDKPLKFLASVTCNECGHVISNKVCSSVIKAGFIAPPGYKIINADYASLEPRCFAFMSGDQGLKDVYLNKLDLYSKVYCDTEDIENKYSPDPKAPNFLKKLSPKKRVMVKPVVLGVPYGARAYQTARLMNFVDSKGYADVARGQAWIDKYLGAYPNLRKYMLQCELEAITNGEISTIVGRTRHFKYVSIIHDILMEMQVDVEKFLDATQKQIKETPHTLGLNEWGLQKFCEIFGYNRMALETKGNWSFVRSKYSKELNNAKNHPIQGLAAHITNKGMLDTTRLFSDNKIDGYVALQVHDELMCYAREDQAKLAAKLLRKGMEDNEFALLLDIPMEANPIICTNLKDAK